MRSTRKDNFWFADAWLLCASPVTSHLYSGDVALGSSGRQSSRGFGWSIQEAKNELDHLGLETPNARMSRPPIKRVLAVVHIESASSDIQNLVTRKIGRRENVRIVDRQIRGTSGRHLAVHSVPVLLRPVAGSSG